MLWRSRGLLAALVLYPIVLALLVALVADEAGSRPRIAWVDGGKIPAQLQIGSTKVDYAGLRQRISDRVDVVDMEAGAAQEALDQGRVQAVVVVPSSLVADLRTSVVQPKIDVIVRGGAQGERALREVETLRQPAQLARPARAAHAVTRLPGRARRGRHGRDRDRGT